ncbi:hypothetical protein [Chryseobacterium sp. SIMBA_028]|uniref:hypothetical protein n=1 Tax=Chryseobacterium sp. SIMBA_028 TaxID=3085771 RepID=UPI00397C4A0A
MKKLESLKEKLFEKELSMSKLRMVTGAGSTLSGCQWTANPESYDCGDNDQTEEVISIQQIY